MKIHQGEAPIIGVSGLETLHVGWSTGDGSGSDGYQVADYFDSRGRYRGPDAHGIEPIFRDMTQEETREFLSE